MRNLSLCDHWSREYTGEVLGFLCTDTVKGFVYVVTSEALHRYSQNECECDLTLQWTELEHSPGQEIIAVDSITSLDELCVITYSDVLCVNVDTQQVEVAGSVSAGIEAASWSSDEELLALCTGDARVIIMTSNFDCVNEFDLNSAKFGEAAFVDVGWGKKETQFHGTQGKGAAKKIVNEVQPVGDEDDGKPRITWRGDGQLFAVSYVTKDTKVRKFRVFDREGAVQYTSEDVIGLEMNLAWKPSGAVLTSSQKMAGKHEIIFFEKNGLRHGSFKLPFAVDEVVVRNIKWNFDSSVLLVHLTRRNGTGDLLQLWTVGNYHWYLKQQLTFVDSVKSLVWDEEDMLCLHVLAGGTMHTYRWVSTVARSKGLDLTALAQVAVIDGKTVKLTPFRQSIIPPPMSAYEVTLPSEVQSIMYAPASALSANPSPNSPVNVEDSGFLEVGESPGSNSNNICVVHGDATLTFLTQAHPSENLGDHGCVVQVTGAGGNGFSVQVKVHRVLAQHKLVWDADILPGGVEDGQAAARLLYNWVWVGCDTMLACCRDGDVSLMAIVEIENVGVEGGVRVRNLVPVDGAVVSITANSTGEVVLLQLSDGSLLRMNMESLQVVPWEECGIEQKFPTPCTYTELCELDDGRQVVPLGLSSRHRFYSGSMQLAANCTSFLVHDHHLLLTTHSHNLLCVPLTRQAVQKMASGKEVGELVGTRRVERGSKIVTAVPKDTRVVLQMPRGNLEMISPRSLAVHTLKQLLGHLEYGQAVAVMRKQRINLNLLVDHDPHNFLKNTDVFVRSVDKPSWIDLFIACLSEEDVTKTMYASSYYDRANSDVLSGKVDAVCVAVRKAMVKADSEKFLLPILTSYVKMTESQMDSALHLVKSMKDVKDKEYKVSAEEGLRHLLYIADVNELYNVALGTYDFEMVLMVAEKSQKDPKEFLPFLNNLKKLEENYCKYQIDKHLRRFRSALKHAANCSEEHHEEFIELIKKERLYKDGLKTFAPSSLMYCRVSECYADYLYTKGYEDEAALMYARAGKHSEALAAYEDACNWRQALIMAMALKYNRESMRELYLSLVERLKEKKKHIDAAYIYEHYLHSEEDAVVSLVAGSCWDEASCVAAKFNRPDLVETLIMPGVLDHGKTILHEIEDMKELLERQCARLLLVRNTKEKEHMELLEGKEEGLDSDLYSDSSTVSGMSYSRPHTVSSKAGTSITGRTYRSAKNKRKLERKKFSTKEGSTYEDLGLIAALHELISRAHQLTTPVSSLLCALVSYNNDELASQIQNTLSNLLNIINKRQKEIWPDSNVGADEEQAVFGPQLTTEGVVARALGEDSQSFVTTRMRELEAHLRYPPYHNHSDSWKLQMLNTKTS
ncbi:elongator complex protein 1 [Oratosquilla oratoria]|uniref:elongator complex protein 1 n=1 Tax=Oratosquilla oratoria TaxID=337810 RepID=UPI003F75B47F